MSFETLEEENETREKHEDRESMHGEAIAYVYKRFGEVRERQLQEQRDHPTISKHGEQYDADRGNCSDRLVCKAEADVEASKIVLAETQDN